MENCHNIKKQHEKLSKSHTGGGYMAAYTSEITKSANIGFDSMRLFVQRIIEAVNQFIKSYQGQKTDQYIRSLMEKNIPFETKVDELQAIINQIPNAKGKAEAQQQLENLIGAGKTAREGIDEMILWANDHGDGFGKVGKEIFISSLKKTKRTLNAPYYMFVGRQEFDLSMKGLVNQYGLSGQVAIYGSGDNYMLIFPAGIAAMMEEISSLSQLNLSNVVRGMTLDRMGLLSKLYSDMPDRSGLLKFDHVPGDVARQVILNTKGSNFPFMITNDTSDLTRRDFGTCTLVCQSGGSSKEKQQAYSKAVYAITKASIEMASPAGDAKKKKLLFLERQETKSAKGIADIFSGEQQKGYIFYVPKDCSTKGKKMIHPSENIDVTEYWEFEKKQVSHFFANQNQSEMVHNDVYRERQFKDSFQEKMTIAALTSSMGNPVFISEATMEIIKKKSLVIYDNIKKRLETGINALDLRVQLGNEAEELFKQVRTATNPQQRKDIIAEKQTEIELVDAYIKRGKMDQALATEVALRVQLYKEGHFETTISDKDRLSDQALQQMINITLPRKYAAHTYTDIPDLKLCPPSGDKKEYAYELDGAFNPLKTIYTDKGYRKYRDAFRDACLSAGKSADEIHDMEDIMEGNDPSMKSLTEIIDTAKSSLNQVTVRDDAVSVVDLSLSAGKTSPFVYSIEMARRRSSEIEKLDQIIQTNRVTPNESKQKSQKEQQVQPPTQKPKMRGGIAITGR